MASTPKFDVAYFTGLETRIQALEARIGQPDRLLEDVVTPALREHARTVAEDVTRFKVDILRQLEALERKLQTLGAVAGEALDVGRVEELGAAAVEALDVEELGAVAGERVEELGAVAGEELGAVAGERVEELGAAAGEALDVEELGAVASERVEELGAAGKDETLSQ